VKIRKNHVFVLSDIEFYDYYVPFIRKSEKEQ